MTTNKSAKKEREPWVIDDIQRLLEVCKTEHEYFMIIFLWQTGCRKNELFRLERSWIKYIKTEDQPYGYLNVPVWEDYHQITEEERSKNVDRSKPAVHRGAKSETRRIPISKTLHDAFTVWFKNGDREFGKYHNYPNIRLNALAKKAGINKYIIPHSFRHTFVTDAYNNGVRIQSIKKMVGHADEKMINTVYLHIEDGEAASQMKAGGMIDR